MTIYVFNIMSWVRYGTRKSDINMTAIGGSE